MHLLLVFMHYLRPGDPGIKRFNEFCRLWTDEHGLRVTVITGQIHYNSGEFYPDCVGKPVVRESDGPVEVYRLAGPNTYGKGYAGKAVSQIGWSMNVRRVLSRIDRPDLVIGVTPPLWASWPAVTAKRRFTVPMILEIRDLWPEAIVRMGVAKANNPLVLAMAKLERWAYANADHLVGIFDGHRNNIIGRGLKSEEDFTVIPHGVLLDPYENLPEGTRKRVRGELGITDDQVLVIYTGAHGPMYDLMKMVDVAEALRDRKDIQFVSYGAGFERDMLIAETKKRGLDNLRFPGPVPVDEVPSRLCAADIALSFVNAKVLTGWDEKTVGTFRNALFDYAAAKLPVLFNDIGYTVAELQDRAKGGFYANTEHGPGEMAGLIVKLADDPALRREMGENNHREIGVRYNRRKMAQVYVDLMHRVSGK